MFQAIPFSAISSGFLCPSAVIPSNDKLVSLLTSSITQPSVGVGAGVSSAEEPNNIYIEVWRYSVIIIIIVVIIENNLF